MKFSPGASASRRAAAAGPKRFEMASSSSEPRDDENASQDCCGGCEQEGSRRIRGRRTCGVSVFADCSSPSSTTTSSTELSVPLKPWMNALLVSYTLLSVVSLNISEHTPTHLVTRCRRGPHAEGDLRVHDVTIPLCDKRAERARVNLPVRRHLRHLLLRVADRARPICEEGQARGRSKAGARGEVAELVYERGELFVVLELGATASALG